MKKFAVARAGLVFLLTLGTAAMAQERAPAELDQMLGPIALYPDPLLAEILSAATFPSEIVLADRYITDGGDPNQAEQQPWDPSVQGLLHYPAVLKWLDDNLPWTTQIGQAFASQQTDVMDSVQRLRAQAQSLGNLPSTPQETVTSDQGDIEIEPTVPEEMYVPDYQPNVIYEQPGVFCTFGIGLPIGFWLWHDWDWHGHRMIAWGRDHPRPSGWFHQSPGERHSYIAQNHPTVWRPSDGAGHRGGGDRGYAPRTVSRPPPVAPRSPAQGIVAAREASRPAFRPPSSQLPNNFARPETPSRAIPSARSEPAGRSEAPVRSEPPVRSQPAARPEPPLRSQPAANYEPPIRSQPTARPQPPIRSAPVVRASPTVRSEPAGGVFGGFQSGGETRQSSSRGVESRGAVSPSSSHGGGGGSGGGSGSNKH